MKALPLVVHFTRMDHKDGLAPYFREYLRLTMTAKKPERKDYASCNLRIQVRLIILGDESIIWMV